MEINLVKSESIISSLNLFWMVVWQSWIKTLKLILTLRFKNEQLLSFELNNYNKKILTISKKEKKKEKYIEMHGGHGGHGGGGGGHGG